MAPGGGAGMRAAAISGIKAVMPMLYKGLQATEPGSKENQALLRALSALNPIFGKPDPVNTVPAAVQQIAQAAKGNAGPLAGAPPPGLAPAAPPETPPQIPSPQAM